MSFAKNAYGFDVPYSGVVVGDRDFHYLVKRYDRYDGDKYEQRDFAQIMDIQSNQKYYTTSERLFDAIADMVKCKEERLKFLEFYLFSFVIENAINYYIQALESIPSEFIVPTNIVLSKESVEWVMEMNENPPEPTQALIDLMREDD